MWLAAERPREDENHLRSSRSGACELLSQVTIAAGEYVGGQVSIWDHGNYVSEKWTDRDGGGACDAE